MVFVLSVEALAAAAAVVTAVNLHRYPLLAAGPWPSPAGSGVRGGAAVLLACLLAVVGVAHMEVVRIVERTRRVLSDEYAFDSFGAWTFAAALILPPVLTIAVILVVYLHAWARSWRARTPMYRALFSATSVAWGALAAFATMTALRQLPGIDLITLPGGDLVMAAVAGLVFGGVNHLLVTVVVAISDPQRRRAALWGSWDDNILEATTLCIGALAAAIVVVNPALVLLVPAPLVVITRAALVRELRQALDVDDKTGLLTLAAWRARAERLLAIDRGRARVGTTMTLGVLMCDIDHFKKVNDAYGHIAGDVVLRTVADTLRAAVRPTDLVARFGGEEFLIMLVIHGHVGETTSIVLNAAERIRARIAGLRIEIPTAEASVTIAPLTMSIGAVSVRATPGITRPLEVLDLVGAADSAVYAAKRAGRDQVCAAPVTSSRRPPRTTRSDRPCSRTPCSNP